MPSGNFNDAAKSSIVTLSYYITLSIKISEGEEARGGALGFQHEATNAHTTIHATIITNKNKKHFHINNTCHFANGAKQKGSALLVLNALRALEVNVDLVAKLVPRALPYRRELDSQCL